MVDRIDFLEYLNILLIFGKEPLILHKKTLLPQLLIFLHLPAISLGKPQMLKPTIFIHTLLPITTVNPMAKNIARQPFLDNSIIAILVLLG